MLTILSAVPPGGGASGPTSDGPPTVAVPVSGREEPPEGLFGRMVTSAGQQEGPTVGNDRDGTPNLVFPPPEEREVPLGLVATDAKQTTPQSAIGSEAAAGGRLAASLPNAERGDSAPSPEAGPDLASGTSARGLPTLQKIQTPDRIDLGRKMRMGETVQASPLRAGAPDTGALGAYSSAMGPEAERLAPTPSAFAAPQIRSADPGRGAGEAPPGSIAPALESGPGLSVKTAGAGEERIPAPKPQNDALPALRAATPSRVFPVTARISEEMPLVPPPGLQGAPRQGVTIAAAGQSGIGRSPGDPGATVSPALVHKHGQSVDKRPVGGAPAAPMENSIPGAVAGSRPPSPAGGGGSVGYVEAGYHSGRAGTEPPPPPAPNQAHSPATGQAANAGAPLGPARDSIVAMRETLSGMAASVRSTEGRDLTESARDLPRPRSDNGRGPPAAGGIPAPGSMSAADQVRTEPRAPSASDPDHGGLRSGTEESGQPRPAFSAEYRSTLPEPKGTPGLTAVAGKPQVVVQGGEAGGIEARSPGGDGEPLPLASEPAARSAAPAHGPFSAGPEQARAVAVSRQIAEAAGAGPNGQLEVSLSPEELGRVKLTITPQDAGLAIAIQAERPETLELMRRHIDVLVRELADEGFASLSFDFGQGGREAGRGFGGGESSGDLPVVGEARGEAGAAAEHAASSQGGLDLRL